MKIDIVAYSQKFVTGAYLNCTIGFEASITEHEHPEAALKELQNLAESFHKSSFSHLYTESGSPITIEQVREEPADKRIAVIIQDIMDCQVIDEKNGIGVQVGLLGFEKMCSTHPELKSAYDLRLKQLQNA